MVQNCLMVLASTATIGAVLIYPATDAVAQNITLDGTLGAEGTLTGPNYSIPPSLGQRVGNNLFHSFSQFNLDANEAAIFSSTDNIQNILSRVTGGSPSFLDGLIRTLGNDVNLFLINPSGIIFGNNASLDVSGSFVASTANAIQFGERGFFSATNPEAPSPLLTVNPSAFFFNQLPVGRIENSSIAPTTGNLLEDTLLGLRVSDGNSLLMVGGDIAIDGGGLHALGGHVELAAIAGLGTVGLNVDGNDLSLNFAADMPRADISLTNEAFVNTSGEGGGAIRVWGKNVRLSEGSQIAATTLGTIAGAGVTVNASESVELTGTTADNFLSSGLFTQTGGTGDAGDITITTKNLRVANGARILAGTFSQGSAGDITINASELVEMTGATGFTPFGISFSSRIGSDTGVFFGSRLRFSPVIAQTPRTGKGGNLTIQTGQLRLLDGAQIGASTRGSGDGGNLTVNASQAVELIGFDPADGSPSGLFTQTNRTGNAGNITVNTAKMSIIRSQSGSFSFGQGNAGDLTIFATESVEVSGKRVNFGIESPTLLSSQVETSGEGQGGNLTIETRRLSVNNGGKVQVATFGRGDAGNLLIRAAEVDVFDTPADSSFTTGILAGVEIDPDDTEMPPEGDGGELTIETERLRVRNGAEVSVSTAGLGNSGRLRIQATELVEIVGTSPDGNFKSRVTAAVAPEGTGNGGNLSLETRQMIVRDGAEVTVSSLGSGLAGNLEIQANSLRLANQGAIIATTRAGDGGNIIVNLEDLLLLRNNSQISTDAGNQQFGGNGGNITINSPLIVAFPQENSDITANAFTGNGGGVEITTNGIFGIAPQASQTEFSDITASSDEGISGEVNINRPDVDPARSLTELPSNLVDVSQQIAQGCTNQGGQNDSRFVVTGRGGLPLSPHEPLRGRNATANWVNEPIQTTNSFSNQLSEESVIKEAQGWTINSQGNVVLVAEVSSSTAVPFTLACKE